MSTDPRKPLAITALLLCLLASAAPAQDGPDRGELHAWLGGDDPVVVILVLDGFRVDLLGREAPDGRPLMPTLDGALERAWRWEDALSGSTHPLDGLVHLVGGRRGAALYEPVEGAGLATLAEAGFAMRGLIAEDDIRDDPQLQRLLPWAELAAPTEGAPLAAQTEAALAVLDRASGSGGPQVVLLCSDLLLPPFLLGDEELVGLDPSPWQVRHQDRRMEDIEDARLARARRAASAPRPETLAQKGGEGNAYSWAVDAAHRRADRLFEAVLQRLGRSDLRERSSLILTARTGTALGDRPVSGAGRGAGLDQARVPLLWWPPAPMRAGGLRQNPVQSGDLARTLAALLEGTQPAAGDLFVDDPSAERWTLARGARGGRGRDHPFHEIRWTTPAFTLIHGGSRARRLFDRAHDPQEYEDLSRVEPALLEAVDVRMREHIWGATPTLELLWAGREDVEVVLDLETELLRVEPGGWRIERESARRLRLHSEGSVEPARLVLSEPKVALQLAARRQGSVRPTPLALGATGEPTPPRPSHRLGAFDATTLKARADALGTPARREDHLHLRIVPGDQSTAERR